MKRLATAMGNPSPISEVMDEGDQKGNARAMILLLMSPTYVLHRHTSSNGHHVPVITIRILQTPIGSN